MIHVHNQEEKCDSSDEKEESSSSGEGEESSSNFSDLDERTLQSSSKKSTKT